MNISTTDARGLFTKKLIDVYQERTRPTGFLRSFFPNTNPAVAPSAEISIEVERMFEKVASDVVRGSEGNRNTFSRSTEKIFIPPIWREYFDATQLDLYDRVLGSQGTTNENLFAALLNKVADRLGLLQDKIERAKELQCAQVLLSGIVTIQQGLNVDFKRKSASSVDLTGSGGYWATNNDVTPQFKAAGDFLRTVGKSNDAMFEVILGDQAQIDLFANTKFQARQNFFHMQLDDIKTPVRNSVGGTLHGAITAGPYMFRLWSYPEFYDILNDDGSIASQGVPYIDTKKAIVIPQRPRFHFAHALVPQLIAEPGQTPQQAEYVLGEFTDKRRAAHDFDIQSAGLPVPVAVDQIYTMKAVA